MIRYLENPILQRVACATILSLWIIGNFQLNTGHLPYEATFGIAYLWVFIFPASIFLCNVLINSIVGWYLSMVIFLTFAGYVTFNVWTTISSGYHTISTPDMLFLGFTLTILAALAMILIRLRTLGSLF